MAPINSGSTDLVKLHSYLLTDVHGMKKSGTAMIATPMMMPQTIEIILNIKNMTITILLYLSASAKPIPRFESE